MTDNPTDRLLRDLALKDSGWHRQENPETGVSAFFPSVQVHPAGSKEQRALEDAWEARSLAMHADQKTIVPTPKPEHDGLRKIARGD